MFSESYFCYSEKVYGINYLSASLFLKYLYFIEFGRNLWYDTRIIADDCIHITISIQIRHIKNQRKKNVANREIFNSYLRRVEFE